MGFVGGSLPSQRTLFISFKCRIFSLITSIHLTASIITPTMVFTVVVENVLAKLSDVIPRVDDMIEREHRAELLRLYDQFFKNQEEKECDEGDVRNELVELIRGAKMMREEEKNYIPRFYLFQR